MKTGEGAFWKKVSGADNSEKCWLWTGANSRGYGQIGVGGGKLAYAHRFSWQIHRGPVPSGMCVCHSCDNPLCVNPSHLFLGTHADNMRDMGAKGRARCTRRKLSDGDVHRIVALRIRGVSQKEIAAEYGVLPAAISKVVNGKTRRYAALVSSTQLPHGKCRTGAR